MHSPSVPLSAPDLWLCANRRSRVYIEGNHSSGKMVLEKMLLEENVPLAPLTTFKLGGPARYFVEAKTTGEVQEAVAFAGSKNLPIFVLGGGSNLVVADSGWPGLVLKIAILGIEPREEPSTEYEGRILFDVGAGESWDRFVWNAIRANCAGVECLSGIPGSVGGTPVQNVGAY